MRILVVTNLFPTKVDPIRGTFVKEQIESLREQYPDLIIDVRVIEGDHPKMKYLIEMLRLPRVVRKGRYDIVHGHFGLTLVSMLLVRVPVVITFHGSDLMVNRTKHLSRLLAPKASRVIVVAKKLRESLGYGEVIPCGIPVKKFALPPFFDNESNRIASGKSLRVLFPSNPKFKIKNYSLFRAICEELERRGNRVERIHLANIDRAKVQEVYWNSDLMLLTSLSEGSPAVIKEAIAARLPFVAVDVGDVKEWARLIDFGVVVSSRDPKRIADSVINLIGRIINRPSLDNNRCLEAMDNGNIAKRIKHIYDNLVEHRY